MHSKEKQNATNEFDETVNKWISIFSEISIYTGKWIILYIIFICKLNNFKLLFLRVFFFFLNWYSYHLLVGWQIDTKMYDFFICLLYLFCCFIHRLLSTFFHVVFKEFSYLNSNTKIAHWNPAGWKTTEHWDNIDR